MDYEQIYSILQQFIKCAGLTNKQFAEKIGLPQSTFQTMLKRKNVLKSDVLSRIMKVMAEICKNARVENSENAYDLCKLFMSLGEYLSDKSSSCNDESSPWEDDDVRLHRIILDFLEISGYSDRDFAILADINLDTFQNMLTQKSKLRAGFALRIYLAMGRIIEEYKNQELSEEESSLLKQLELLQELFSLHISADIVLSEDFRIATYLLGIDPAEIATRIGTAYGMNDIFGANGRSRLLAAFDQLNEKGQETLIERAEELLLIEKYRKTDTDDE